MQAWYNSMPWYPPPPQKQQQQQYNEKKPLPAKTIKSAQINSHSQHPQLIPFYAAPFPCLCLVSLTFYNPSPL